jgi:hypothetical protein
MNISKLNLTPRKQLYIVLIITFLAFFNSLFNKFVWDDQDFINWEPIHHLNSVGYFFNGSTPSFHEGIYRPVRHIFYAVSYSILGREPAGYHLQGIAIHLLATAIVWLIAKKLTNNSLVAFIGALLFGVHPVHVEAVSWLTASFDTIGLVLALGAYYLYLIFLETNSKLRLLASLSLGLLAFLTNELTLVLPLMIMITPIIVKPKTSQQLPIISLWSIFIFYWLIRLTNQPLTGRETYLFGNPIISFLTLLVAPIKYALLLIFPIASSPIHLLRSGVTSLFYHDYENNLPTIAQFHFGTDIILAFAIILFSLVIAIKLRKKHPFLTWAIFWFYISLLPVMQFIPQPIIFAERYLYLTSVAFCIVIAVYVAKLTKINNPKSFLPFVAILAIFGVKTIIRNFDWQDSYHLWEKANQFLPGNPSVMGELGWLAHEQGDNQKATELLNEALKINPKSSLRLTNLGEIYQSAGKFDEASNIYNQAINLNSKDTRPYLLLGSIAMAQQDFSKAETYNLDIIKIDPYSEAAHNNLAGLYLQQNRISEAFEHVKVLYRLHPSDPQTIQNYQQIAAYLREHPESK